MKERERLRDREKGTERDGRMKNRKNEQKINNNIKKVKKRRRASE